MLGYLMNITEQINPHTNEARNFAKSLRKIGDELGLELPKFIAAYSDMTFKEVSNHDDALSSKGWVQVHKIIKRARKNTERKPLNDLAKRIHGLTGLIGINKIDTLLLNFLLHYEIDPNITYFVDEMLDYKDASRPRYQSFTIFTPDLAHLLGVSQALIHERLAFDSPLVQSGIVSIDDDGEISVLSRLRRLSYEPMNNTRELQQVLFEKAPSAELEWCDFDHVATGRDHIERLIVGALKTGERGVNILIHGPPGTGKTEFCKTLAERIDVSLFLVGESDKYGCEPSRMERLQELRLADQLLGEARDSVLLFDEMEDLLSETNFALDWGTNRLNRMTRGSKGSRVFMHRLLEQNAIPTVWTTNSARQTNPTLLRRMMYALELRQPSSRIRKRIWHRQLERHGVPSSETDAETLASDFDVAPGVVDRAVAGARLVDTGDIATVYHGVESLSRLLHGPKPPKAHISEFDPFLICANTDLMELSNRLSSLENRQFSLCLQGPPGTGKSAFVRYLGKQLGLEIVQKRASDLLSMWVGETEARIAAAFAEARDQEQFLVFDEADSLLADRRFALRNWEISQVNEMLTWMETHPLPFACTTNYDEHLDPATLRRFNFKLRLDYLSSEKVEAAFTTFFKLSPPKDLLDLTNLTPGDFAVVRRQAEVLGKLQDAVAVGHMLKEESENKPDQVNPIGFRIGYT